jgi:DNA-binding response OmpR family regulator
MKKNKVLYVEDEVFLGRIVKDSLETRDFEVMMISDGKQVVAGFHTFQPDICILDVMLPNKDGYTLAQELRALQPHLPILFLTAKTQTEDLVKGFESGGNDYIRKPFSLEELIVRIHNLLELSSRRVNQLPTNTAIPIGLFEFMPARYELKFDQNTRKLSHRETELLKIFAEQPNQIIQRKDILLRVWGDDSFYNSRNLDVYITKLRDYLKDDPSIQIISIKGIGYHFLIG